MNIIQLAKAQVAAECSTGQGRVHSPTTKKRGVALIDGELQWVGEYTDARDSRPCKLANGDKQLMSAQEQKLFARTPFERGITEYHYEGSLRVVRPGHDPKDPRHSYREGHGVLKYPGGETFEGLWKMNKRFGPGYLSTPKGYRFQGEWKDDVIVGQGHETFSNRSAYDCAYEGGLPEGTGVLLYTPSTGYRYEGEFKNGRRHGRGTIFYENGDVFTGMFDQGKRHGRGVTTTRARGKEIQYESEWNQDQLVGAPQVIEKSKRTRKPKSEVKYSVQGLAPADLTKWKVKDDVTELSLEHFLRIKLGFEKLDLNGSGSLSTTELTSIWGKESQGMLQKLDTDGNGTVELDEIFAGWYPNVPRHNIQRFMQLDISPKQLLRHRGFLCGIRDEGDHGYMQLVGVRNLESEEDRPLMLKQLDAAGYKIGGEKFSLAMYEAATVLCDPPHFLEVLEAWYPNIPRSTLARYEMAEVPPEELDSIKSTFYTLSDGKVELSIEEFDEAQGRWREGSMDPDGSVIDQHATEGFFKGQPFWVVGPIRVSVTLLQDIDKSDKKMVGGVSLQQLLRYCYPNVRCKRTQEMLTGKRKVGVVPCACQICAVN
jgi:hypothetical protein